MASFFAVLEYTKSQSPSTKLQTNFKFQYQMTETGLVFLNFGHCDLFGIWDLLFGMFGRSRDPADFRMHNG
jgi:hypothetical protein